MNKADLIGIITEKTKMSKMNASETIDIITDSIVQSLVRGESVSLIGFGTFSTVERAPRVGRNPKTGQELQIDATTIAKFKPGKALKDAILLQRNEKQKAFTNKDAVTGKTTRR